MRIAIIGAGSVGSTLGAGWASAGHDVVYGLRDPSSVEGGLSFVEAVRGADVVVNALPFGAVEDVFSDLRVGDAVLVDVANPLTPWSSEAERQTTISGAERLAVWSSSSRVVKAFNTTGVETMAAPGYPDGRAVMLVAADDAEAKQITCDLASALGFEPADAGPLSEARDLEHLANLWVRMALQLGHGRGIAFGLRRR